MQYVQRLLPCDATSKSSWNKDIAEGNTILELWDNLHNMDWKQVWVVVDTKTGKVLTQEEFRAIVNKLKGW